MTKTLFESKRGIIVLALMCVVFCSWLTFVIYRGYSPNPTILSPSQIVLRGGRIMVFQLTSSDGSINEFEIDEKWTATHVVLIKNEDKKQENIQISPIEKEKIEAIRTQWCNGQNPLPSAEANTSSYEIAVRCPLTFRVVSFRVPQQLLPSPLDEIVSRSIIR